MYFSILISALLLLASMSITWLIQLKHKNAGIVDITWSYNFAMIAIALAILNCESFSITKIIFLIMVLAWSVRLGTYLFIRNVGKPEDARYAQLRKDWGTIADAKMLGFYYLQGVMNLLLCIPFFLIFTSTSIDLNPITISGTILFTIALLGESTADAQLSAFKKNPANKGKVCDKGLWNYSRHPNYFFEWLIWVSFFVFALSVPMGYISILSPIIILWTLIKATGIPMTEEQSIKSKGDLYREYQKTTSAFIPWFKK